MLTVGIGSQAPDFTLHEAIDTPWRLSSHRGRVVVLLFYPGDETLVCTQQLCAVRARWSDYIATGAEIVGISPGTNEVHKRFSAQHELPMKLLTDKDRIVTKQFAAHELFPIWMTRALIVIDAGGIIRDRHILLRAFRPSNRRIFTAIHLAQYDKIVGRQSRALI